MHLETIRSVVIPRLIQCRVISITLTGGEPFAHPDIIEIVRSLRKADLHVSICTNATLISLEHMKILSEIGGVLLNVSLDGFRPESHGKFRGNKDSFFTTVRTIQALSQHKLLKGLLVTPNTLANIEEYTEICNFAVANGATYVLTNPLSRFGRGIKSRDKIGTTSGIMKEIRKATSRFGSSIELVNIRFPNDSLPLAACEAGNIIYIFTTGEVTVCPYLIFAVKTPGSMHKPEEFMVGNILLDANIGERLDNYKFHERYQVGDNQTCKSCSLESGCGKGCPAAVISAGQKIGAVDQEVCPIFNSPKE